MSETTVTTTKPSAVSAAVTKFKTAIKETAFIKSLNEFKRAVYIGLSISTNKVTKFNSLATAIFILAGVHLLSVIIGSYFGYFKASTLLVPLQVFSFATQLFLLSYLFPVVHYVMKFYQHKRNIMLKAQRKQWKANQKALAKQQKEAEAAEKGTYVI